MVKVSRSLAQLFPDMIRGQWNANANPVVIVLNKLKYAVCRLLSLIKEHILRIS